MATCGDITAACRRRCHVTAERRSLVQFPSASVHNEHLQPIHRTSRLPCTLPHSHGSSCADAVLTTKAVTRGGVFWVFEHPRNFREKLDTQKQIYY